MPVVRHEAGEIYRLVVACRIRTIMLPIPKVMSMIALIRSMLVNRSPIAPSVAFVI